MKKIIKGGRIKMKTVLYDETDFCEIAKNEKGALMLYFRERPDELIGLLDTNLSLSDIVTRQACDFLSSCLDDAEETLHKIFDGKAAVFSYRSKSWNNTRNGFCVNDFFTIYEGLKNAKGAPACIEINDNAVHIEFPDHDGGEFITVKVVDTDCDYWRDHEKFPRLTEECKKFVYDFCALPIPGGLY